MRRSSRLPMWWKVPAQTWLACSPIKRLEPADHLPGRAAGEGDEHDRARRDARGDQVGDAIRDHPRLARAGPGEDQVIAVGRGHGGLLRVVQLALKVIVQPGGQRRFQANFPHRSHHTARIPDVSSCWGRGYYSR